jgi:hypothetical protein
MEQFEPEPSLAALGPLGTEGQDSHNAARSKRHGSTVTDQDASLNLSNTMEIPALEQRTPQRSKRKLEARPPSTHIRRSPRLCNPLSATAGAAPASKSDSEAPHTHLVATPPESRVIRDLAAEQPPPPSPLAASQRQFRPKLSRAQRKLYGASHRFGLIYLQILTSYLQCIREEYFATGQSRVIYFSTNDMAPTRDWKAIPAALVTRLYPPNPRFHC